MEKREFAQRGGTDETLEIDLLELLRLLQQHLLWIVLFLLIGAVAAGLATRYLITPLYVATSKLYIVSASNDSVVNLSDLQVGASLTHDYEELVLGRPMLESVIANLELEGMSVSQVSGMVRVSNPSNTRILNITVTSPDPMQAMEIANEMARLAIEWLPEVMKSNEPTLAEDAVLPVSPSSPSMARNVAIGAMASAALYCAFIIVQYLMNDSIRNSEDFERFFGFAPLASVPEDASVTMEKSGGRRRKAPFGKRERKGTREEA